MTVFWRKYNELCDERGIKPRTLATELGISAATVTKWVNDGMPNLDMITRIAEYFDVPIDYLINEDDTPIIPQANKKRSVFKSVSPFHRGGLAFVVEARSAWKCSSRSFPM